MGIACISEEAASAEQTPIWDQLASWLISRVKNDEGM
jgi:hypothetical protein